MDKILNPAPPEAAPADEGASLRSELASRLGHTFNRPALLKVALTHRSFHFENRPRSRGHFERYEFLGDAVLDLTMSELLMTDFPDVSEGTLSKWRASLVNEIVLSEIASTLELQNYLYLGRSEAMNRATPRPRLLASALEAVLAAVYLDGGLDAAKAMVRLLFAERLFELDPENEFAGDFKTRLQEWSQKRYRATPEYKLRETGGPEHAKRFHSEVLVQGESMGIGEGGTRKAAEQAAAEVALQKIEQGATK